MRDDLKNTESTTDPGPAPETLKFYFTPVSEGDPEGKDNPLARKTTYVPDVVEALRGRFGDAVLSAAVYANEHTVYVRTESLVEVCRYLKTEAGFIYFVDLGGIDRFTEEDRYEVFYNLVNIEAGKRLRLKVRVDEENPVVPSVTEVFRAANWHERECLDMFGIRFEGHPDPRRMFLPEDFEYYPLRKEFPLLGIPGSLPLPPRFPEGDLTLDPFAAAHAGPTPKSFDEPLPETEE